MVESHRPMTASFACTPGRTSLPGKAGTFVLFSVPQVNMTLPNRSSYQLRSREKSAQNPQSTWVMTASDAPVATFAALHSMGQDEAMELLEMQSCDDEEKPAATILLDDEVQEHLLLPVTQTLMAMVAQPTKLLAALVVGVDQAERSATRQTLWAKAMAYQTSRLKSQQSPLLDVLDAVEAVDHSRLGPIDVLMMKAALYYWSLWQYVCVTCVDAVAAIEKAVEPVRWPSMLQKRRAESLSPTSSDALSQSMIRSSSSGSLAKRSRLTKKSNEFLIAWFLAHKDNPYPSASERTDIADKTGLAEQQVRNWFANMRKRHWKPNRSNAKKPRCLLDYVLRKPEA